jgi:hypothetical protein
MAKVLRVCGIAKSERRDDLLGEVAAATHRKNAEANPHNPPKHAW